MFLILPGPDYFALSLLPFLGDNLGCQLETFLLFSCKHLVPYLSEVQVFSFGNDDTLQERQRNLAKNQLCGYSNWSLCWLFQLLVSSSENGGDVYSL